MTVWTLWLFLFLLFFGFSNFFPDQRAPLAPLGTTGSMEAQAPDVSNDLSFVLTHLDEEPGVILLEEIHQLTLDELHSLEQILIDL